MTAITIHLNDQTKKRLETKAIREGVEIETLIVKTIENAYQATEIPNLPSHLDTAKAQEAVEAWLDYKREKKQKYTKRGLLSLIKKIGQDYARDTDLLNAIEHSMANNYAGIFPDKKKSVEGGYKTQQEKTQDFLQRVIQEEEAREQERNSTINVTDFKRLEIGS